MKKFSLLALSILLLAGCASPQSTTGSQSPTATTTPAWFEVALTDVQTGETFTMNDFAGKVVLVETMAVWCPTCILQAAYIYRLHEQLESPDDLISVSLDVDLNENADDLSAYVTEYGFDWRFAVAPLEVARALGNLYSAQYLNPPLAPMLIIDRQGNVHPLPFELKDTETLHKAVAPYLNP